MKNTIFILTVLLLTACTDTNHKPLALDDNFGRAYRQVMQAQILNPYAAQYPPMAVKKMEGDIGRNIMETYREGYDRRQRIQPVNINIGGSNSGSTSSSN